jgi:hypothetical protein
VTTHHHFAEELLKLAFKGVNVPKVTLGKAGITPKTGSGVPMPATLPATPAVTTPIASSTGANKAVPTAAGANLGTKVVPRPRTTPSAEYGGSLVR